MKKIVGSLLSIMMLTVCMCSVAFAETNIGRVYISFTKMDEEPGKCHNMVPTVNSNQYEMTDWIVSTEYENWKAGKKVTFTVTIEPSDGYTFSKSGTDVSVSGNGSVALVSNPTISSDKIVAKINYTPSMKLEAPSNIYFEDEFVAVWDRVEGASKYEAQLTISDYDGKTTTKTVSTTTNRLDLSEYSTGGEVSFKLRAIPSSTEQSKYLSASDWVDCNDTVSPSEENSNTGSFVGNYTGMKFTNSDYESGDEKDYQYVSGWVYVNGKKYYFDPNNDKRAVYNSWKQIDGNWYAFDEQCAVRTGWYKEDGFWYYLSTGTNQADTGKMMTGWISMGPTGPYYCLNNGASKTIPLGAMFANCTTPDGYTVNASGALVGASVTATDVKSTSGGKSVASTAGPGSGNKQNSSSTTNSSSGYVYASTNSSGGPGSANARWELKDKVWYLYYNNQLVKSNWAKVDGYWYVFDANGCMLVGWVKSKSSGVYYYLNEQSGYNGQPYGSMLANCNTPDGFYIDASGALSGKAKNLQNNGTVQGAQSTTQANTSAKSSSNYEQGVKGRDNIHGDYWIVQAR